MAMFMFMSNHHTSKQTVLLIVALGLLFAQSTLSSYWQTQRDNEDITISLQYINDTKRQESVQISVFFDRRSNHTSLGHVVGSTSNDTSEKLFRPQLSLSSDMDALIHATLGRDELLMMIEGPSLQATIGTIGRNCSHQTGLLTIPIAGLYNLKVVRTRQWYRAIDEKYVDHPELSYDVLIDALVKLRVTTNIESDNDVGNFSGYWKANDKTGLYLRQPQNSSTGGSSSSLSPSASSSSPLSLVSYELWHDDKLVNKHFFRSLPSMYTRVRLSSSSRIVIDGTDKPGLAQANSPIKSHFGQSKTLKSMSCAVDTNNFHWVWTKHPTTLSRSTQSNPTLLNETVQSNSTTPNRTVLQSNSTGIALWLDEAAAEALLLNAFKERRTLLFVGDSHMRTFREALIGWICNLADPHKISSYLKGPLPFPTANIWPSFRPVNDQMCAARLVKNTQYVAERYCNPTGLPPQSSGRVFALVNCGHTPASGGLTEGMGQWPIAKYTRAVLNLMAAATGSVKSDRAQSNSPVKTDHVQSNSVIKTDRFKSNQTAPIPTAQSNHTALIPKAQSNIAGLGYDPHNLV